VDMCNNVTYSTKQILVANWEDHKPSVPCLSKHFSNTMENNHQVHETPTSHTTGVFLGSFYIRHNKKNRTSYKSIYIIDGDIVFSVA
jgi:hypothetical protein